MSVNAGKNVPECQIPREAQISAISGEQMTASGYRPRVSPAMRIRNTAIRKMCKDCRLWDTVVFVVLTEYGVMR